MNKLVNGIAVPLTETAIAERQAEESEWAAGAVARAARQKILDIEAASGFTRRQREYIVANADGGLKAALAATDAEISAERQKLPRG